MITASLRSIGQGLEANSLALYQGAIAGSAAALVRAANFSRWTFRRPIRLHDWNPRPGPGRRLPVNAANGFRGSILEAEPAPVNLGFAARAGGLRKEASPGATDSTFLRLFHPLLSSERNKQSAN